MANQKGNIMRNTIFQLAGKVNVPGEKKDEMNKQILTILDKCGIRKTMEMTVAGENVTVVIPAQPDADGIVMFDYSIFEKKKRKLSTYDLNTCELHAEDPGYDEFGIVMNMIMILQEAYSDGGCYFVKSGRPYHVDTYLLLLQGVLGERITLPGRIRMWNMYCFFRRSEECRDVTGKDLLADYSENYGELNIEQLLAVLEVEDNRLFLPDKKRISSRDEISSANSCSRTEYAYRIFCSMKEEEKAAMKSFLAELLNADSTKRKEWSVNRDINAVLAELSLYVLPARLVLAYALAVGKDFWELWDSLGAEGYSDVIKEDSQRDAGAGFGRLSFYKAIQRKDEDEFLEFWDGSNLFLSQDMQECMRRWQEQFRSIDVPSGTSTEHLLEEILHRLNSSHCRYVDQAFVTEFLEHENDLNYKKALILLKQLLDKGQEYFPELTGEQANQWIIRGARNRSECIEISAFPSLMANEKQRTILFGF